MRNLMRRALPAAVLSFVVLSGSVAGGVEFDAEATLESRKISLRWEPDLDDPVFTGNLDLYEVGSLQIAAGDVPFFGFTLSGPDIWFWDPAQRSFVQLVLEEGKWVVADTTAQLPAALEPVSFAVHPMGTMLLAGLSDGQVAVWRPGEEPGEPILYAGHTGPVRGLEFKPLASPQVFPFVSIGADGSWREWDGPGVLAKEAAVPAGGGLEQMGLSRSGTRLAVATESGTVYLYNVGPNYTTPSATLTEHSGARVTSITFSEDGARLMTVDDEGRVRLWLRASGGLIGSDEIETDGEVLLRFTGRDSPYAAYATPGGAYGVVDGQVGREFRVRTQLGPDLVPVSWMALLPTGGAAYFTSTGGRLGWWNLGRCSPSLSRPECFGGYFIFRGLYPEDAGAPEELVKLRVYDFSDSTWQWGPQDTLRFFVDPDSVIAAGGDSSRVVAGPHNGMPYYYSLQKFYWTFLDGGLFPTPLNSTHEGFYRSEGQEEPTPLVARPRAVTVPPLLANVYVVPNPYVSNADESRFGPLSPPLVRFFNLPEAATVRIFTSSGDHVRTLEHRATSISGGSLPWDLKNDYGQSVAAGVYLYAIETPSGETAQGFFTIVR